MTHEHFPSHSSETRFPAMLVTSFYNMADTFFVSQLETSASGAVGFTLGMDSGNLVSRSLVSVPHPPKNSWAKRTVSNASLP